jgi:hypothetical protein
MCLGGGVNYDLKHKANQQQGLIIVKIGRFYFWIILWVKRPLVF